MPSNQLYKLQRVQNAAERLICNVGRFEHITPSLFSLHWLPIAYRILVMRPYNYDYTSLHSPVEMYGILTVDYRAHFIYARSLFYF